ncbi:MAG: GntR family transcriptional regulator [Bryobacterales bacterium]|nr:GntR family transcriptional regulator [Bryobacterales bacterium]
MTPLRVTVVPGKPAGEQVAFAARRAILSGQMRPGDRFPSVRSLSKDCKINPNTAHKVVAQLVSEGFLAVEPGIGTVVANLPPGSPAARAALLDSEVERLVVEARRLGLTVEDVERALSEHWKRLDPEGGA